MALDHEKLDAYKLAIQFVGWVGDLLEGPLDRCRVSAAKHLDEASQSIANNIAQGNGKRSGADRCRFLDIARAEGKQLLEPSVSMLWRMIQTFQPRPSPSTSTRA